VLTEERAEEIRRGLARGMRGPVLIKWATQLLADRDLRVVLQRAGREELERVVTGALRSQVAAHGPITHQTIGSAADRVVAALSHVSKRT
jgi:hypothetical protein